MKITANIITLNEEKNIEAVIKSVQTVCDEVLVVDSLSSDRTCEIAESLGAKVIKQAYLGDGPQKAFGAPYASNDWILSIDADERLDLNSIEEIKKTNLGRNRLQKMNFIAYSDISVDYKIGRLSDDPNDNFYNYINVDDYNLSQTNALKCTSDVTFVLINDDTFSAFAF